MGIKTYISIEKEAYDEALKRLRDKEMPAVRFRRDDPLGMANDAIESLRIEMVKIALLLESGSECQRSEGG